MTKWKAAVCALALALFAVFASQGECAVRRPKKCKVVRVCRKGKPCGNGCIARDRKCRKGKGCAIKGKRQRGNK